MTNATDTAARTEPLVLELRVHGVNNTSPASLLDLPQKSLKYVDRESFKHENDDKCAAFWVAEPEQNPADGTRGHIPAGIRREAYSWGGLVRTESDSDTGSRLRWLAMAFQVLALPFSIGNAAMWTRRLTLDTDGKAVRFWASITAGAARLFGLVLTLLFTSTTITIAVDMVALQCAIGGQCDTWAWEWLWGLVTSLPFADFLTSSRILALFTLVPVLAVGMLVWFAGRARRRYDTLHDRDDAAGEEARAAIDQTKPQRVRFTANNRKSVLAQPAFWSNRITGRLALVHFAAAIALTSAQVALHVSVLDAASWLYNIVFWASVSILAGSLLAACILPTMTITPSKPGGPPWTAWVAWSLLALALVAFAILLGALVIPSAPNVPETGGLYSDDLPPLVLVTLGAALAISGLGWRPRGYRAGTAWAGCAPAVFMVISLTLGVLTSSAVISVTAFLVTGWDAPRALAAGLDSQGGLHVPDVFLAVGGLIPVALFVPSLVVLVTFLLPRKLLTGRAETWAADTANSADTANLEEELRKKLEARVGSRRRLAAIIHLVEPAAGWIAGFTATAIVLGLVWTWAAFALQSPLPTVVGASGDRITAVLVVTTVALIGVGGALAGVVAWGALARKPGLIAVVWDITCYLPRTAQPFGPPCYAERAVPDIAHRLDDWLSNRPERRAVLAAHSMGAVISVSALGLLAATSKDPTVMERVSLLTFGVQLRTYFGRLMPELVGPAVLGTYPARSPRPWMADPWERDARDDERTWNKPWEAPPGEPSMTSLNGVLLPAMGVPWINLWRLTDYLGFPAAAGQSTFHRGTIGYKNGIDRYAQEIDRTVKRPVVVTHNDYIRVPAYHAALFELEPKLRPSDATTGKAAEPANN